MKTTTSLLTCLGIGCLFFACQSTQSSNQTEQEASNQYIGEIERNSERIDQLIPKEAQIEVLSEGHDWTEGPVWIPAHQMALFSDIPPNQIFKWTESGGPELYVSPSGYTGNIERGGEVGSNGLLLDAQGNLVLCQHGDRRIARMEASLDQPGPNYSTLADKWDGKRFNSPNDATFRRNGELYFTDPPYGLEDQMKDSTKEIPFQGVYRLDTAGQVHLLTDELSRPNGIAFSPDESKLYVANSDPKRAIWMVYDVQEDGSIANGKVFFDATDQVPQKKGLPDGLKVNKDGYLFATGPGGVLIFSPEGEHLGTINTGEATSNCCFGNDGAYLYVTADMYFVRIPLIQS